MSKSARKKRKVAAPRSKSSRSVAKKHYRKQKTLETIPPVLLKYWDKTKSIKENYDAMGLAGKVNVASGKKTEEVDTAIINRDEEGNILSIKEISREDIVPEIKPAIEDIENLASKNAPKTIFASKGQVEFIKSCIEKHGNNFREMARDKKLNILQLTESQIEKLYKKVVEGK
jgi:hypothetical protein